MIKYLLLIYICISGTLDAAPTLDAIDFLGKSQPVSDGVLGAIAQQQEVTNLYQRQLEAIATISSDENANCTSVLIPYLNYALSPAALIYGRHPMASIEDIKATTKVWPAFRAILRMKDARDQLQQYIINRQNPLNYRLTSFLVLRYVDKASFQNLEHSLDAEFINNDSAVREYLKHIEDGSEQFWGVPDLK